MMKVKWLYKDGTFIDGDECQYADLPNRDAIVKILLARQGQVFAIEIPKGSIPIWRKRKQVTIGADFVATTIIAGWQKGNEGCSLEIRPNAVVMKPGINWVLFEWEK